jgi:hypothetical protein
MTKWQFLKRLPGWSVREALERLGLDLGKFAFTFLAAGVGVWLMFRGEEDRKAVEKVAEWIFYTVPATMAIFALVVAWVAASAIYRFARSSRRFRFEELEHANFIEAFERGLGERDSDGSGS